VRHQLEPCVHLMLKFFAKAFLTMIGAILGLFCVFLVWMSCVRLYGWALTGRFIPPSYTRLKGHDLILFSAEPIRASLEIAGNLFSIIIGLAMLVTIAKVFRHGLVWTSKLPCYLPMAFVLVFLSTLSANAVQRVDWTLPAAVLFAGLAICAVWIELRTKGLSLAATVSDVQKTTLKQNAHVQTNRTFELIAAVGLCLLGILKLSIYSHAESLPMNERDPIYKTLFWVRMGSGFTRMKLARRRQSQVRMVRSRPNYSSGKWARVSRRSGALGPEN